MLSSPLSSLGQTKRRAQEYEHGRDDQERCKLAVEHGRSSHIGPVRDEYENDNECQERCRLNGQTREQDVVGLGCCDGGGFLVSNVA